MFGRKQDSTTDILVTGAGNESINRTTGQREREREREEGSKFLTVWLVYMKNESIQ